MPSPSTSRTPNASLQRLTITASGKVDGCRILPRDITLLVSEPAVPSGTVAVIAAQPAGLYPNPDHPVDEVSLATEWALVRRALLDRGHRVVAYHAWERSEADPVGLAQGLALARDAAAVAAHAPVAGRRDRNGGSVDRCILLGHGLAASAGVFGATVLRHLERIALDGRAMPTIERAVLLAPLWPLPIQGTRAALRQRLRELRGKRSLVEQALQRATPDLFRILDVADALEREVCLPNAAPPPHMLVLHGKDDPVSPAEASRHVGERLPSLVDTRLLHTDNHHLHRRSEELGYALQWLDDGPVSASA